MTAQSSRLRSFPIPKTGETVYSLFSRYATRTGFQDKIILESLTNQRLVSALLSAVPGHIPKISTLVPEKHPWTEAKYTLLTNTAFPYYTYFDSPEKRETTTATTLSENHAHKITMSLGLTVYPLDACPEHPRFCPACVEEDIIKPGFAYYRREHQLPGVVVCWRHGDILNHGCAVCGTYPIINHSLCMPGRCGCSGQIAPLVADENLPQNHEALTWFAQQSALMVNSQGTACENIRHDLRSFAMDHGISKGSLLDYHKLASAINSRYGAEFLNWLGAPAFVDGCPAPWVRRLLYSQLNDQKRSPAIFFLLIIGTFFDSISAFEESIISREQSTSQSKATSTSVQTKSSDFKSRLTEHQIKTIIDLSKKPPCGIPGIADRLGVKVADVVATIKGLKLQFPLTARTIKRLGVETIAAIRRDLLAGIDKTQIQKLHNCSEWSVDLIVLDDPSLNDKHKEAREARKLNEHKSVLVKLLENDPLLTRTKLQEEISSGTYEYLLKHDPEWFDKTLPQQQKTSTGHREKRRDWDERDKVKANKIQCYLDSITAMEKPVWITETRLLKRAKILYSYHENTDKYPRVSKLIRESAESRSQFRERKLKWAIIVMRNADIPLSINKLRRVAGLPANYVRNHRAFILATSAEVEAKIDMNSFFIS